MVSPFASPLVISQSLLTVLGTRMTVHFQERIPQHRPFVLISNHRSFLDAPLLMVGVNRSIRFACHRYMTQVPGLREVITAMGCLPLEAPGQRSTFLKEAMNLLRSHQPIGIFPEGASPMVQKTAPDQMGEFQRGFAHLAMRAPVEELVILPVAIAATQEASPSVIPLRFLRWFDPSEPLFDQPGWHPAVVYQQVHLLIGRPVRITERLRSHYQGRGAARVATEITECCQNEIATLLRQGCD